MVAGAVASEKTPAFDGAMTTRGGAFLSRVRVCGALFVACVVGGVSFANADIVASPTGVEPLGPLRDFAVSQRLSLGGIKPEERGAVLRDGEGVVAVLSLSDKAVVRQWLVVVGAAGEWSPEPESPKAGVTVHTSTGRELRFPGVERMLRVRVAGPFASERATGRVRWQEERLPVNGGFLALGLERVGPAVRRLAAARKVANEGRELMLSFDGKPYPAEVVAANREKAEALGLTLEEERALGGSVLALAEFLQAWLTVPALRDAALEVAGVSRFTLATRALRGQKVRLNMAGPYERETASAWGVASLTEVESLGFGVLLGDRELACCRLVVASPRPPLLASAGVLALTITQPDGTGPVLHIQVVGSVGGRE